MTSVRGKLDGLRILIAEDEDLLAQVLIELVELHGGTIAGVIATEHEAREVVDGPGIDGAILDIRLKSGPCFTLAEELTRRHVPVILTTGHTTADIPDAFEHLPVFTKPFSVEALVDCLEECCSNRPQRLINSGAD